MCDSTSIAQCPCCGGGTIHDDPALVSEIGRLQSKLGATEEALSRVTAERDEALARSADLEIEINTEREASRIAMIHLEAAGKRAAQAEAERDAAREALDKAKCVRCKGRGVVRRFIRADIPDETEEATCPDCGGNEQVEALKAARTELLAVARRDAYVSCEVIEQIEKAIQGGE